MVPWGVRAVVLAWVFLCGLYLAGQWNPQLSTHTVQTLQDPLLPACLWKTPHANTHKHTREHTVVQMWSEHRGIWRRKEEWMWRLIEKDCTWALRMYSSGSFVCSGVAAGWAGGGKLHNTHTDMSNWKCSCYLINIRSVLIDYWFYTL